MLAKILKRVFVGVLVAVGSRGIASALIIPPPPPPTGFTVALSSSSANASWQPNPYTVVLSGDNAVLAKTYGSYGSIKVNASFDLTKPHQFTLINTGWTGNSSPAVYNYTPPLLGTVFYSFNNMSSAGTVMGNVTIALTTGNVVYSSSVNPGQTLKGQNPIPAGYFQVTSMGTSLLLNKTVTCYGSGASGGNISGYTVVVNFHNADNPQLFSCDMQLNY